MANFAFSGVANTFYSLGEVKRLWFRAKIPNIDGVMAFTVHFGLFLGLKDRSIIGVNLGVSDSFGSVPTR